MKKFLILISLILVIITSVIAFFFLNEDSAEIDMPNPTTQSPIDFPFNSNPNPNPNPNPNHSLATENEIKQVMSNSSNDFSGLSFSDSTIVNNYALQVWYDENVGGEALLKYRDGTGWEIVSFGGGAWSLANLVQQGVPSETARVLINNRAY